MGGAEDTVPGFKKCLTFLDPRTVPGLSQEVSSPNTKMLLRSPSMEFLSSPNLNREHFLILMT